MKTKKECEKLIKKLSSQLIAMQHVHPIQRIGSLKEEDVVKAKINMLLWVCEISNEDARSEVVNG